MKKIAILGKGTAGCLNALKFHNLGYEINWYNDPHSRPTLVGEGADLNFPRFLSNETDLDWGDLSKINGHYKEGIVKHNWGNKDFTHWFNLGTMSLHFDAYKFQNYVQKKFDIIDEKVDNPDDLDVDHIIDCSGTPEMDYRVEKIESIPVKNCYIVQCDWKKPKFKQSLCIARPYGWVFGIPLPDRCTIGYLFNHEINSTQDIMDDLDNVFEDYNLKPSHIKYQINFSNYKRITNFTNRISYNGNASFFLEPMEATSISTIIKNIQSTNRILEGNVDPNQENKNYSNFLNETEDIIMLHYLAGSKFNTKFWDYAEDKAHERWENTFKNYPKSKLLLTPDFNYSTWMSNSLEQNIKGLGLDWRIKMMMNG